MDHIVTEGTYVRKYNVVYCYIMRSVIKAHKGGMQRFSCYKVLPYLMIYACNTLASCNKINIACSLVVNYGLCMFL